jgi:hypothetical protein
MVGFIDPVGTSFQSAIAERKLVTASRMPTSGLMPERKRGLDHREIRRFAMAIDGS